MVQDTASDTTVYFRALVEKYRIIYNYVALMNNGPL